MVYYAVAKGFEVGIFQSWAECEQQVKGYSGAKFKKFKTKNEAENFITNAQNDPEPVTVPKGIKGFSACLNALAQLEQQNSGVSANTLQKYQLAFNNINNNVNPSTTLVPVKTESLDCQDYIPLENYSTDAVKKEIKEETFDSSLWFQDTEGDQELLNAMSELDATVPVNQTSRPRNQESKKTQKVNKEQNETQKENIPQNLVKVKIEGCNFLANEEGFVCAYLGENEENIGSWNCVAGYGVYFDENNPYNISRPATGRITRNVGAIEAAIYALETAKEFSIEKICLYTDSEFLLKAISGWIFNWKCKGWRNQHGKVVQNRKEFEKLDNLLSSDDLTVKWENSKDNRLVAKQMKAAKALAEIGTGEYLDQHPAKEDMDYSDESFDCDFLLLNEIVFKN